MERPKLKKRKKVIRSSPKSDRKIFQNMKYTKRPVRGETSGRSIKQMVMHWNKQTVPKWKKLNATHGGNPTKVYAKTVGLLKNFLSGKLLRSVAVIPKDLDVSKLPKFTREDFFVFVDRYAKLCLDPLLKNHVVKPIDLATFLAGSIYARSKSGDPLPSIFLMFCLHEPKSTFQDPNPDQTFWVKERYHQYVDKNKVFSANDEKILSELGSRLLSFAKDNPIKTDFTGSRHFGIFFQALGNFKPTGVKYFLTDHAWDNFLKEFTKLGFVRGL